MKKGAKPDRQKLIFRCTSCGSALPKWSGQCPDCGVWNAITEEAAPAASHSRFAGNTVPPAVQLISEVETTAKTRIATGEPELDRVLGGGLVEGSVVLIGGDPGIGKSTLLLQTLTAMSNSCSALYVTGEESPQQVSLHAQRLNINATNLSLLAETQVASIIATARQMKPRVMVIDSIQTLHCDYLQSAPGSVSQVRDSAAQLVQFAKQCGTALFLVGHVTKDGTIAGPRVLEHMVDTVLYFEGDESSRYRLLLSVKNRFGAVNELVVFAMTETGLRGVSTSSTEEHASELPSH